MNISNCSFQYNLNKQVNKNLLKLILLLIQTILKLNLNSIKFFFNIIKGKKNFSIRIFGQEKKITIIFKMDYKRFNSTSYLKILLKIPVIKRVDENKIMLSQIE